jgi:hypothetical protein
MLIAGPVVHSGIVNDNESLCRWPEFPGRDVDSGGELGVGLDSSLAPESKATKAAMSKGPIQFRIGDGKPGLADCVDCVTGRLRIGITGHTGGKEMR